MVRFFRIMSAIMLWVGGLIFIFFAMQIAFSEILPALNSGTFSVATSSTVLNREWVGNEIYLLLLIYLLAAITLVSAGTRMFRNTLGRNRQQ